MPPRADSEIHRAGAPVRPGGVEPLLILACGALAREIAALTGALPHVTLRCLPAILHNRPERIAPAVRGAIASARAEGFARIFVAYAACGTAGALDEVLAQEGIARLEGPHCYAVFTGGERFAAQGDDDMRAFYLTDFLARHFEVLVIGPLGLDRHPELRDAYFGGYESLVHLAQTEDAALDLAAKAAAERLGLRHERRFTGYGDLGSTLARMV